MRTLLAYSDKLINAQNKPDMDDSLTLVTTTTLPTTTTCFGPYCPMVTGIVDYDAIPLKTDPVPETNNHFRVVSCNDYFEDGRPEMTISVTGDYYIANRSGLRGFGPDSEGNFIKKISEDDLDFQFSDDSDDIILSYTMATDSSASDFSLTDTVSISFGMNSIRFQCRYSRNVFVDQDLTLNTDVATVEGTGQLHYRMLIDADEAGGYTNVVVQPYHNFAEIIPSIINCRVTSKNIDNVEIYPIHSFKDDTLCFDKSRLNVQLTTFASDWVEFKFRTFLFKTGRSTTQEQSQKMTCEFHLDAVADAPSVHEYKMETMDCPCYTVIECASPED